jgi:hypothetical protein
MDTDPLVDAYLARLRAAAAGLPAGRRDELATEVREHIDAALAEAGQTDETTVRNILERLGPPEEIVAAEGSARVMPEPAAASHPPLGGSALAARRWGAQEALAAVSLGLAWPALLLPFGPLWWLGLGVTGLVLVWASAAWRSGQKAMISGVVVALYVVAILLTVPVSVQCTTGSPPQACPPAGPSPVVTGS